MAGTTLALALLSGCGPTPTAAPPASANPDIRRDAIVEAIEQTMPSVVSIATSVTNEYRDQYQDWVARFYGKRAPSIQREELSSMGSGVVIDESGYVVTSFHVVSNASRWQVKFSNGDVYDAQPVRRVFSKDVALLKIVAPSGKKFRAMKFAKDDDLLLGESVIAVGNPFGLGGSVTRGILSSKNRRANAGNEPLDVPDWLQTDADINPGNSGGPLINLHGELIGLNVATGAGQGIGFAIPVKQISAALSELFTPEALEFLWFGARVGSFNAPLTIVSVQPRSPAEKAGLQVGQRILSVNGQQPHNLVEFHQFAIGRKDSSVTVEVEAAGSRRSITVRMIDFRDLVQQRLGITLRPIKEEDVPNLHVARGAGVIVETVEKDGPADKAQIQPGFIITGIDDRKMSAPQFVADVISAKETGERLKVFLYVPHTFGTKAGEYTTTLIVR